MSSLERARTPVIDANELLCRRHGICSNRFKRVRVFRPKHKLGQLTYQEMVRKKEGEKMFDVEVGCWFADSQEGQPDRLLHLSGLISSPPPHSIFDQPTGDRQFLFALTTRTILQI